MKLVEIHHSCGHTERLMPWQVVGDFGCAGGKKWAAKIAAAVAELEARPCGRCSRWLLPCVVESETDKALRVRVEANAGSTHHGHSVSIWLPKSQVERRDDEHVVVPGWLLSEKEREHGSMNAEVVA